MKIIALFLLALLLPARGEEPNLVPNGNFSASKPLDQWRTDFPYEPWYVANVQYVKVGEPYQDGHSVLIELPPKIAGNEGGKIESAFIKADPGATYKVQVDCQTSDFAAKLFVEAWAVDPKPISHPDKFRVPARDGRPPLVMCYRAQVPDPPGRSSQWTTVSREFTLPRTVRIAGQEEEPIYLSLKAFVYLGTQEGGKSFFANFRLTKVK